MASATDQSAEDALRRAGEAGVHLLAVPTPFAVGRVNCWLIDDDPLTLVDTGPNSATSLTTLETALASHGRRVEDLERIVVSHQHIDHLGLVGILAERSGAEVCALDLLAPWMASYSTRQDADDGYAETIMLRHGIPEDVTFALRAVSASFRAWGASATVTRPLAHGSQLEFANRSWQVYHRPGHSPSDTIFHDEARSLLIGADHLIRHISSNPLIARPLDGGDPLERPQALVIYLNSMQLTSEMELDIVLPGHGEPITDHRGLIEERRRMHTRRADKIAKIIGERPRSAYEIAQSMWGNVAVTQAYLTLSEVLGHVDLLLNDGRVEEIDDDGVVRLQAK
jgi:glyoxylase-like metal-dependent hydrolase (beta-lactamase superfamily II)